MEAKQPNSIETERPPVIINVILQIDGEANPRIITGQWPDGISRTWEDAACKLATDANGGRACSVDRAEMVDGAWFYHMRQCYEPSKRDKHLLRLVRTSAMADGIVPNESK